MRVAHDAKLLDKNCRNKDDAMQDTERDPNRFPVAAPEAAPEVALKHKSEQGLYPSRIVTRYDTTSPEEKFDGAIYKKNAFTCGGQCRRRHWS